MKFTPFLITALFVPYMHALTKIDAIVGDITLQTTDIIVNAANQQLAFGGGVCGAIFQAAGIQQLQKACDQYPLVNGIRCQTGDARITDSFKLKKQGIKKIIHAVGPDARIIKDPAEQRNLLESVYSQSLILATKEGCTTISFPFISAGIYQVDPLLAAQAAVTTVRAFVDENRTSLREIRFILHDTRAAILFQNLLSKS
jgi:O-acetyl-ADP-ribose deacetylase (regulator of RNase III)